MKLGYVFVRSGTGGDREILLLLFKMSNVLERLRQEVERVKLLRSRKSEIFEAVKDPALLRSVFEKIDQNSLMECNVCPVAHVLKHVQQLHALLVAERAAVLEEEEGNQPESKVEMIEHEYGLRLHVSAAKWDGAVTAILEAIEAMGLTVVQADISCDDLLIFDALLKEDIASAEMEGNANKIKKESPSP